VTRWVVVAPLSFAVVSVSCGEPMVARNPYPEGLDTLALESAAVLIETSDWSSGDSTDLVALDVGRDGTLVVGDGLGRVWVRREGPGRVARLLVSLPWVDDRAPVIGGVAALADGRIAVRNASAGEVTVHGEDGGVQASWPVSPGRPPHGREALLAAEDGTLLVGMRPPLHPDSPPVGFPRPVFARRGVDGTVLDTLWVGAEVTEECPILSEGHFRAGWYEDIRERYLPKPLWAVGVDGTLVRGCPASYAFQVERPDGSVLAVSRGYRPYAVSERERSDFARLWRAQMNNSGVHDSWSWSEAALPGVRPAYQRFLVADDGRFWVWPARPTRQQLAPADWPVAGLPYILWTEASEGAFDVFSAEGRLLGHVRLPERLPYTGYPSTPDPVIRGDTLWAVTVGEAGQAVERFHITWGSETREPPGP
jgi:hypothetical protein